MTGLMQGKKGLIMGVANDHSIAWGIAQACAAQGAQLALTYQGDAFRKRVEPLAEEIGVKTMVDCDVSDMANLDRSRHVLLVFSQEGQDLATAQVERAVANEAAARKNQADAGGKPEPARPEAEASQ